MIVQQGQSGIYEGIVAAGLRLAETPEAEGGWLEYFSESEDADLRIEDPILRGQTAIVLENCKRWQARVCRAGSKLDEDGLLHINEATRSALVGGFSDYLFPIIRAAFPTNPINDLVSVQPTNRRTATVIYWNWIYGSTKGDITAGQRAFDAQTGKQDSGYHYSDNVVDGEAKGAGPGADTVTGTLTYHDGGGVIPGSIRLTLTHSTPIGVTATDNSAGGFVLTRDDTGAVLVLAASSIDYATGVYSIQVNAGTFTNAAVTAYYRWDSEGSSSIPQMDVQITTSTTETQRRAMQLNYSTEALHDVMTEFGVSLEPNLISGCAEQMNFEIARQIIASIWAVAPIVSTFPITGSAGYNQQDHFKDIVYYLNQASNNIWQRTQKGYGNWLVVDEGAANVVESLPRTLFVPAPRPASVQGLHFIGTLQGKYRVYKDWHLINETGASATGNVLMGFKGTQFFEAGFVWSPYQMLYTTDSLTTADFLTQKGMASRYATKMVNPDFYARINLSP